MPESIDQLRALRIAFCEAFEVVPVHKLLKFLGDCQSNVAAKIARDEIAAAEASERDDSIPPTMRGGAN